MANPAPTTAAETGDALSFDGLRAAGIRELERLAGGQWTDFNTHDPGITILEQVCWALTDLGYRLGHPIPDLLAEGGGDGSRGLVASADALGCEPVTIDDLRRLILDIDGVGNCWIEPVETPEPYLHYHRERHTLGTQSMPPETVPLKIKGLWRVLVACADCDDRSQGQIRSEVARTLYAHRPLCQDFDEIGLLPVEGIAVSADIEIGPVADPESLLHQVLLAIADYISPRVGFATLQGLEASGAALEDLLQGPRLRHGFIADADLPSPQRRTSLRTSDLIRVVMDVPGVRAVRDLRLVRARDVTGGRAGDAPWQDWVLELDPALAPRLESSAESIAALIRLHRDGLPVRVDGERAKARLDAARSAGARRLPAPSELAPPLPGGRDRRVGRYRSILHQFPQCYGVGPVGLTSSTPPLRRARSKQLKAYLQIFDQLLADAFAQAAAAGALLAGDDPDAPVYAVGHIEAEDLGLDALRSAPGSYRDDLGKAALAARSAADDLVLRRRQLDHLLARSGEVFVDPPPGGSAPDGRDGWDGVEARRALLSSLGRAAAARGTALDSLGPAGPDHRSGLALRIALKLGLRPERGERFFLVEHLLLRAVPGGSAADGDEGQTEPLLREVPSPDPYSLQLSFVFPGARGRFAPEPASLDNADCRRLDFRCFVEYLIREETPAHLTPYVRWLADDAFDAFAADWANWHERRRASLAARYGIAIADSGV